METKRGISLSCDIHTETKSLYYERTKLIPDVRPIQRVQMPLVKLLRELRGAKRSTIGQGMRKKQKTQRDAVPQASWLFTQRTLRRVSEPKPKAAIDSFTHRL
jgi:hypothetical protein